MFFFFSMFFFFGGGREFRLLQRMTRGAQEGFRGFRFLVYFFIHLIFCGGGSLGFGVWGLGFRVQGWGLGVQDSGLLGRVCPVP